MSSKKTRGQWPYLFGPAVGAKSGFPRLDLDVDRFIATLLDFGADVFGGCDIDAWDPVFSMKETLRGAADTK